MLRKAKRWPQRLLSRYQNKLLILFLLVSVVPILIIGISSFSTARSIAEKQMMTSVSFSCTQMANAISNRLAQMERVANSVQFQVYSFFSKPHNTLTDYFTDFTIMRNNLDTFSESFQLHSIRIFMDEHELISQEGITVRPLDELESTDISDETLKQLSSLQVLWCKLKDQPPALPKTSQPTGVDLLSCCGAKSDVRSGELEYVYMVNIPCEEIAAMLSAVTEGLPAYSYLSTSSGEVLASSSGAPQISFLPTDWLGSSDSSAHILHEDQKYLFSSVLEKAEWYTVTLVDTAYIVNSTASLVLAMLVLLLLVLIALLLFIPLLSRTITTPLNNLTCAVEAYDPDDSGSSTLHLPQQDARNYPDEFDRLTEAFSKMADRLEESFRSVVNISLQKEKLRYELLQAKINPHFLYNILDSLYVLQSLGRTDASMSMCRNLAHFYRQILRKSNDEITLAEELQLSLTYLELERECRAGRLSWEIDLQEDVSNALICKFTLQPLLENCVLHALPCDGGCLHIRINARLEDADVLVSIEDNGAGMDPHMLEEITSRIARQEVQTNRHYGMVNVNARLCMFAGRSGCLSIHSTPGVGTTVMLRFPYRLTQKGENHHGIETDNRR